MSNQSNMINHTYNAALTTSLGGGVSTVVMYGLHLSDICLALSTFATICGVAFQFYLGLRRIEDLEVHQVKQTITNDNIEARMQTEERKE